MSLGTVPHPGDAVYPPTDADIARLRRTARGAGLVASALAVVVGVGWTTGADALTRLAPGSPTMMPNTAAMLLCSALPVLGLAGSPRLVRLRVPLLVLVLALAVVSLLDHVSGGALGSENLLRPFVVGESLELPSPYAATAFLLLAAALLGVGRRGGPAGAVASGLAALATATVAAAVVGVLVGATDLRHGGGGAPLSVPGLVGLVALAVAVFALRPDVAPASWYAGRGGGEAAARRVVPLGLLLPGLAGSMAALGAAQGWWSERFAIAVTVVGVFAVVFLMIQQGVARVRMHERDQHALQRESNANRRRFETIVTHAPVAMFETDAKGNCVYANDLFCEISGLSSREVLGRGWGERAIHPDDFPRVHALWRAATARGDRFATELRFRRPDGVVTWLIGYATPLPGEAGEVTGYVASFLDISERHAEEETTARVVDRIAQAVTIIGRDGHRRHANAAACKILDGLSAQAVDAPISAVLWGAVRIDGTPLANADLPAEVTRRTGRPCEEEIVGFPARDGTVRWLRTSTRRLTDGPLPCEVVVSFSDVTERIEQRMRLTEAEERFRASFDHAPIGIALVSVDGRFLRVNRALCDMTGYAEGELLARTFQDITHPDDLVADLDLVAKVLAGDLRTYEIEKRYLAADGSSVWGLLSVALVRTPDGAPSHFVSHIQDITARKRHERALRDLSERDALTGLANRRQLAVELDRRVVDRARSGAADFAVVLLDLDHFKYINDSLGHNVGDRVLRAVADALSTRLRGVDLVARLGGDEFACVLSHVGVREAEAVTRELLGAVRALRVRVGDDELTVSASAGVVGAADVPDADGDALLAAADLAMYTAKDAGRDRVAVHREEEGARARASERLNWSHRIRDALREDRFVLHYQPIVDLRDATVRRCEALLRLREDDGTLVAPGVFLPVAERYGQMPAIDRWVARRVIETLAAGELPADVRVALNVSAHSLADDDLLDLVERLIVEHDLAPGRLCFELTESAAIGRLDAAAAFGRRLQTLGCAFAMDDFGTGFGSLTHLKHLPYGLIKIDGEFIRGLPRNRQDRAVVEALVHLARASGKETVAEFVQDQETLDLLVELGVDMVQGFHLGRPGPTAELFVAPRRSGVALGD